MRIAENFIREIKDMMREVRELKAQQFIGRDSILGYRESSAAGHDLSTSLAGGQSARNFIVTYNHDNAKRGAIIEMHSFVGGATPVLPSGYIPPWANGPDVVLKVQKIVPHENTRTRWYLTVANGTVGLSAVSPIYVKLLFEGMDSGSFSITEI